MSKVALINDLHWGIKNDSPYFIEYFREFYDNIFFPTLKEKQIRNVKIMGDIFDKRPRTTHTTLKACKEILFDRLADLDIHTDIIVGNHDSVHKNTLTPNAIELFLKDYYCNIVIIF